jgi:hypothetical protein
MSDFSGARWQKSRRSQDIGACVEIARCGDIVGVRDSKDPAGPMLEFGELEFAAFLRSAARGAFTI